MTFHINMSIWQVSALTARLGKILKRIQILYCYSLGLDWKTKTITNSCPIWNCFTAFQDIFVRCSDAHLMFSLLCLVCIFPGRSNFICALLMHCNSSYVLISQTGNFLHRSLNFLFRGITVGQSLI